VINPSDAAVRLYQATVRPLLFHADAEWIHELAMGSLAITAPVAGRIMPGPPDGGGRLAQDLLGARFPNPVGLAAGFDKRARAVPAWPALGFGFSEVGTITAHAQPGNPRPRIVRLPADRALINRLGFNNDGAAAAAAALGRSRGQGLLGRAPLGVNLGKSKITPAEEAPADYARSLELLHGFADYVTVNVSSPNTPGLRDLQATGPLGAILDAIDEVQRRKAEARAGSPRPVLVKIAPDLDEAALDQIAAAALLHRLDGLIVSNTTIARPPLRSAHFRETGGLSGAPLRDPSTAILRGMRQRVGAALTLVGVGGIASGADAYAKIRAGATLVQLYTALVYEGPGLVRRIKAELAQCLTRDGYDTVAEAVGADA
jgi:dihydroorotate dehydrogenase